MTKNNYLFIHQNMPAQFLHLCLHLRDRGHNVVFITRNKPNSLSKVTKVIYDLSRTPKNDIHPYLKSLEEGVLHGQAVFRSITNLLKQGFKPDIVIGHAGWGETLFIKDILPDTPVLNYWEFFYKSVGQDVNFDPEHLSSVDSILSMRIRNSVALLTSAGSDWGLTPTQWQYSTHPPGMQAKMSVIHEGVDTLAIRPNPEAIYRLPGGRELRPGMKIVTYVARNLEPYRGFHVFMRALPEIQRRHPDAEILIVGQDGVSYGGKLPEGDSYKKRMLAEVSIDPETVHFTGQLATPEFRTVMQISSVHIYLTYPFVLSWSMLEAMATGCVIVGSNTAPVQEVIVDRENGLLVDFFDLVALIDRVDEVLANPSAFTAMREAARRTAMTRYDLRSVCLPRQIALVDSLIRAK